VFSSQRSIGTRVLALEIASIDEHPKCAKRQAAERAPKTMPPPPA
jgi:hypothetical protein